MKDGDLTLDNFVRYLEQRHQHAGHLLKYCYTTRVDKIRAFNTVSVVIPLDDFLPLLVASVVYGASGRFDEEVEKAEKNPDGYTKGFTIDKEERKRLLDHSVFKLYMVTIGEGEEAEDCIFFEDFLFDLAHGRFLRRYVIIWRLMNLLEEYETQMCREVRRICGGDQEYALSFSSPLMHLRGSTYDTPR